MKQPFLCIKINWTLCPWNPEPAEGLSQIAPSLRQAQTDTHFFYQKCIFLEFSNYKVKQQAKGKNNFPNRESFHNPAVKFSN